MVGSYGEEIFKQMMVTRSDAADRDEKTQEGQPGVGVIMSQSSPAAAEMKRGFKTTDLEPVSVEDELEAQAEGKVVAS
ncbi:hypothetical protein FQN51_005386 [Onygenales sp. PD_10]|nr:hypothetical protein FQN51_005386 [Onygenales sp. PD_10]